MSEKIVDDKIEEIRDRTDMVELVSSYVSLKRSGVNHFGLCPFHSEKSPSFSVNSARQRYHCFGCGEDGDAFSFLMKMEGLSFPEAIRTLGERVGVEVTQERPDPQQEKRRRERETLLRINERVAGFYHRILMKSPEGEEARRYLKSRGYDAQIATKFQLGYAPDRWETLTRFLDKEGIDRERSRQLGLIRPGKEGRSDYDLFRGRLIFPIDGNDRQIVAFGGRLLGEGQPKYINSPESPLYHKGRVLYGLARSREAIRRAGEVMIVEGYFDLLALYRAGIENVVATCGTALTEEHARMVKRYADTVRLLFDQDKAGQTATFRAMEALLPAGLSVSVVELEAGDDPDTFLSRQGNDAFSARMEQARSAMEVFIDAVFAEHGDTIEGQARAAEKAASKLSLLAHDMERDLYLKRLAERSGIDVHLLRGRQKKASAGASYNRRQARMSSPPPPPEPPGGRAQPNANPAPQFSREDQPVEVKAQHMLISLMVWEPGHRGRVAEEGPEHLFADPAARELAGKLLDLFDEQDEWEREELLGRLSEEQKTLLSGILVEKEVLEEDPDRIFEDCRKMREKIRLKKRSRELTTLIRDAEKTGNRDEVQRLLREQIDIKKKL